MNGLRRISQHLVKATAAGGLLLASALPFALANTAGAATFSPNTPPAAPTGLIAASGLDSASIGTGSVADATISLSWSASVYTSNGASAATGYNVYEGTTAGGESTTALNGAIPLTGTSMTVPALTDGTAYFFTVQAVNAYGSSTASTEATDTPAGVSSAPTAVTIAGGNTQSTISWAAPAKTNGSAVVGYNVYVTTTAPVGGIDAFVTALNASTGGSWLNANGGVNGATAPACPSSGTYVPFNGAECTALGAYSSSNLIKGTSETITGLSNGGTGYYFVVTAVNGVGESQGVLASSSATTPGTVATALTGVFVVPGSSFGQPNTTVEVAWPSVPGETFNVYEGTTSLGETATPINLAPLANNPQAGLGGANGYPVTGLTPNTSYYFYVKAINTAGSSTPSNEVVYLAGAGVPDAPTGVTAVGANTSATVTWTAPANTGGSAIADYVVRASSNNGATWGVAGTTVSSSGATHLTVTGLTNGLSYVFDVAAVNLKSFEGAFSTTSNSVVPAVSVPSAVTALGVSISGGVATLTWPAANATGGANSEGGTIAGYGILVGTTSGAEALVAEVANGGATTANVSVGTSGTYYFEVVAQSNLGIGAVSNEAVATSGAGTPLTPPTALTTSIYSSDTNPATGASEQTISFTPSTNDGGGSILAPAAGYAVYQVTSSITAALAGSPLPVVATAGCTPGTPCVDLSASDATDYSIGGLTGGTSYSFILVPVNAIGASDGLGSPVRNLAPSSIVTFKAAAVSGAPAGISAAQTGTSVTVTWNAPLNADGTTAIGYKVYTNTTGTGPGTLVPACPSTGACLANVVSGTTAVVSGLSAGVNYFWVTSTNDGVNYGPESGVASATVSAAPTFSNAPAPTAAFGSSGMVVTHGSLTGNPTILHWSATASPGGLSCTGTSDASCTIVGLTNGVTYTFTVSVTTLTGTVTSTSFAPASQPLGVPAVPTVTASAVGTAPAVYSVSLSWSQPANGGSPITLYTATSTNSATLVTAPYTVASALWAYNQATSGGHAASEAAALTYLEANVTPYCIVPQSYVSGGVDSVDTSNLAVAASTTCTIYDIPASTSPTFTYTVTALNAIGHATSAASNSLKLLATGTVPSAPTNFAATHGATTSTVDLSWTTPSATGGSTIVGYNIFEGTASGAETTTPVNGVSPIVGNSVAIPNLTLGQKYFFTVVAVNANGSSAPGYNVTFTAQEISYTAIGSPGVVTGLSASSTAGTSASLSWSAPASTGGAPIIGYFVYAGTSAGGESANAVNTALVTGTSYTVTGLNSGTTYYFVVVADNGLGFSAPSSEANATTTGTSSGVPILPTVTGTYFVPTFSTNAAVVINGTGFTTGMTVTSSNAAYTVTLAGIGGINASGAGTTATLSVTTTSAATAGTSTAIVFKNPDGGAVSFALNGGPATTPPPPVKVLTISGVQGTILTGRTVTITITGVGFYGQPRIISNAAGTIARVSGDTGTRLTVRVTVHGNKRGVHTFTVILANGKSAKVNYTQH